MRIWFSRYELEPKASLGSHAQQRKREGSLLKVEFENGLVGYSDLHPWTELGDASLSLQLESLKSNSPAKLASRSLALARLDSDSRPKNLSCFAGLTVPDSHFLITDVDLLNPEELSRVSELGFESLKLKVGRDLASERSKLEEIFGDAATALPNLRLRLDFNSTLSKGAARAWLLSLSEGVNDAIEFVEDACAWNAGDWRRLHADTGVDLYRDLGSEQEFRLNDRSSQGLVVKPAAQDPSLVDAGSSKIVVTSYLDHPVGQMTAAFEAARLQARMKIETCGLLSHTAYEPTAYSEEIRCHGPKLQPASHEAGIGFGTLLEKEDWKAL